MISSLEKSSIDIISLPWNFKVCTYEQEPVTAK